MPIEATAATLDRIAVALARGEDFLEQHQRERGDFRVLRSTDSSLASGCAEDPSIFPNCLIAHCLSFSPTEKAARVRERLHAWLAEEMDPGGLWRHWPRTNPQAAKLPPDLDDTSCASAVLARAGLSFPDNHRLLLANRRDDGLFYTWIVSWRRWLRHPLMLTMFFRRTSARPSDVDAVVNANALFYLGASADTAAVTEHLVGVLRDSREGQCDKWYEDPFVVWYFLSRALADVAPTAGDMVCTRVASAPASNPLQAALALCCLDHWGRQVRSDLLGLLLESQLPSGAWPRAAIYHGGRRRRSDGSFDGPHPDTPHWGCEELTTAFAVEALCRLARRG